MTAGIAVNNPKAVVISASAIPGATARRVAMFEVESPLKVINTPHTVPNNPMNGATALRLEFYQSRTQGSRSGNPGLKVTTALRFAAGV